MNTELSQMIDALIDHDNDRAKQHLSNYMTATSAKILSLPEPEPTEIPAE